MASGASTCSTSAGLSANWRVMPGWSAAGRWMKSFCLCASSQTLLPTKRSMPGSSADSDDSGLKTYTP